MSLMFQDYITKNRGKFYILVQNASQFLPIWYHLFKSKHQSFYSTKKYLFIDKLTTIKYTFNCGFLISPYNC